MQTVDSKSSNANLGILLLLTDFLFHQFPECLKNATPMNNSAENVN